MRAERLNSFVLAVREYLQSSALPDSVDELARAYTTLASNPGDIEQQARASQAWAQVREIVRSAEFVDTRGWRDAADELGVTGLFGDELLARIQAVFSQEGLTPATVAPELNKIAEQLRELNAAADAAANAFETLGIGRDALEPGEFEVEIVVPRRWVHNELEQLGEEFEELTTIFAPFIELGTGSRPPIEVRSITSSDFTVFIIVGAYTARIIAQAINLLADAYLKVQQGRVASASLREIELPTDLAAQIDQHVNDTMNRKYGEIAERLVRDYPEELTENRDNELIMEIRLSLAKLGPRIEQGFHIEPHGELAAAPEEDKNAEAMEADRAELEQLLRDARQILRKITPAVDNPMLSLPPPDAEGDAAASSEES